MWTIAIRRYLLTMLAGTCIASLGVPPGCAQTSSPTISPDLTIAINQTPESQVLQGEPLVITALLSNPGIFSKNVTVLQINPQNGSWANTVKLMVSDSTGAAANWPAQLINSPPEALTLDSHQTGILKWLVSGADANNIAAGRYQVSAMIDTTASAGTTGWKGTATSDVAVVHVNVTVAPTAAQLEQNKILFRSNCGSSLGK